MVRYKHIKVRSVCYVNVNFFTAGDVLQHQTEIDLENPVTINLEDTIVVG